MRKLSAIRAVRWHEIGNTSPLLAELGVRHGFEGVARTLPRALTIKQVHGTTIVELPAGGPPPDPAAAGDGIVTTEAGRPIAVRTADCLPVLAVSTAKSLALAVHAGWRGLTSGILGEAVGLAARRGVRPGELVFAIGPAIARERYEVGEDVIEALHDPRLGLSAEDAALCVSKGRGDRWHADLLMAAVLTLLDLGVSPTRIAAMQSCTFSRPEWHSYRRDGKGTGSNWSWIEL